MRCLRRAPQLAGCSLTRSIVAHRAIFLSTGDASGVNLGPLTAEELESLRGVTLAQFAASAKAARAKFAKGASSFHGVCWRKGTGKWRAQIQNPASGKREHLGNFDDETEAALAYDKCVSAAAHRASPRL